jgi:hypothetical protein
MKPSTERILWVVGILGGALAGGAAVVAFSKPAAAATAKTTVAPSGAMVVTAPAYVQTAQTLVNGFITNAATNVASTPAGSTPPNNAALATLTPSPLNGSAIDPTFMSDLAAVQAYINTAMSASAIVSGAQTPAQKYQALVGAAWSPLRTDGVLDGFTYQALALFAQVG